MSDGPSTKNVLAQEIGLSDLFGGGLVLLPTNSFMRY
jgi:hypothetical protein